MGWDNPPVPWRELERRLSWGTSARRGAGGERPAGSMAAPGDPPARRPGRRGPGGRGAARPGMGRAALPFVVQLPRRGFRPGELVAEAARLGLAALAITDHDGMYGVPQFAQAAARLREQGGPGIGTIFGAELSLGPPPAAAAPRTGCPTPKAGICWCWPGTRRGTGGCAR